MKSIDKIFEEFIKRAKLESPCAKEEDIRAVAKKMYDIISNNPSGTPNDYMTEAMKPCIEKLEALRANNVTPGYNILLNVGNTEIGMYGGYMDDTYQRKMSQNTLFDVASMSKILTQVVISNLIESNCCGFTGFDTKIKDLCPDFKNIGDLTIKDAVSFSAHFQTPGYLSKCKSQEEAMETLFQVEASNIGKYEYTDFGMIIMKNVAEYATGKNFETLINDFITTKAELTNTYLTIPEGKRELVTGTPNWKEGEANDPNTIILGGFSGSAGCFITAKDWIKFAKAYMNGILIEDQILRGYAYTPGVFSTKPDKEGNSEYMNYRGLLMGNTFIPWLTADSSFVNPLFPNPSFLVQGSTRPVGLAFKDGAAALFFNPASISKKRAEELGTLRELNFTRGEKEISRLSIDPRTKIMPLKNIKEMLQLIAELRLMILFFNEYNKEYSKDSEEKKIEYIKKIA